MKIGIIGGGAAGLVTGLLLQERHEVTVLEAAPEWGGHARTVWHTHEDQRVACETGFRFIFDANYPTLHALFKILNLRPTWRPVNLTIRWPTQNRVLVLPPRNLQHVLKILSPQNLKDTLLFARMMDLMRQMDPDGWEITIGQWGARKHPAFFERIFLPFLASSWGAPVEEMRNFPAANVAKVLQRPSGPNGIYEFEGGISEYINTLVGALTQSKLYLGAAATRMTATQTGWEVHDTTGRKHLFDKVVLAASSRDAARLLEDPRAATWHQRLSRFNHFDTTIVFHKDPSFMPENPQDWSTLNQTHDPERPWSTEWAGQRKSVPIFRTWLPAHRPPPKNELGRVEFHHLIVTLENQHIQREIQEKQGEAGIFVVGMYAIDVDNHESSVSSAIPVAKILAPDSPALLRLEEEVIQFKKNR